jgi:4-amino-4-deoxy-L-arabinose transferase-like glycosyltransferase
VNQHAQPGPAVTVPAALAANPWRAWLTATWPVLAVAFGSVAVLLYYAGQYGMHRDEMYFVVAGRHPAFGYVDQPPLTPLLNAVSAAVFGATAAGIRILPALAFGVVVLLTAAIAREFGGGRRAQTIAALTIAVSGYLDAGHMNTTATYDVLGWTVFLLFTIRVLRGGDPRIWLLAGLAAGITLENKNLILFLGAGLAVGVLIARRWDLLRSRWLWLGIGLAFLIWLPNLAWQASHGWPQLEMARVIAARSGDQNRSELILLQVLFAGPFLFPIFLAGLWWLLRSPQSVAWRPIGWSYLVVLVLLYLTSGKGYYSGGLLPTLMAAGAIVVDGWLGRGRLWIRRIKLGSYAVATAASASLVAVLVLPVIPAASFPDSTVAKSNSDAVSQFGWDRFVAQVQAVADGLTADERAHAAILTANYGEAGALELLAGPAMPPTYSGENSYADWGPPSESRTVTILVMNWEGAGGYWSQYLGPCQRVTSIDVGLRPGTGEEQGAGVWLCRGRTRPWSEIWPHVRHIS